MDGVVARDMLGRPYYDRVQTNYDRIVSKTPEELAEFIEYLASGCDYMYPRCYAREFCKGGVCYRAWRDWLKSEVRE